MAGRPARQLTATGPRGEAIITYVIGVDGLVQLLVASDDPADAPRIVDSFEIPVI